MTDLPLSFLHSLYEARLSQVSNREAATARQRQSATLWWASHASRARGRETSLLGDMSACGRGGTGTRVRLRHVKDLTVTNSEIRRLRELAATCC